MKHLVAGGLVTADEYHYSEKGKEVNHYKLANKYIIIAPKSTHGIKEKLKSILPVGILALGAAAAIQIYNNLFKGSIMRKGTFAAQEAADEVVTEAAVRTLSDAAPVASESVKEVAVEQAPQIIQYVTNVNPALWFLFGCIFVLGLVVILELLKYKRGE